MKAVIVIDMIRGFLEPGYPLYCGDEARKIIPNVVALLENIQADTWVVNLRDSHKPDDPEFQQFPPHCIRGTVECECMPELYTRPYPIVIKRHFDGFYDTTLDEWLSRSQPTEVIVVGVCTDICVMYTVAGLRNRGYSVTVYADCVASFNQAGHVFALEHMEKVLGAKVIYNPTKGE